MTGLYLPSLSPVSVSRKLLSFIQFLVNISVLCPCFSCVDAEVNLNPPVPCTLSLDLESWWPGAHHSRLHWLASELQGHPPVSTSIPQCWDQPCFLVGFVASAQVLRLAWQVLNLLSHLPCLLPVYFACFILHHKNPMIQNFCVIVDFIL